jgi:CheY-like chemotaxis protein
VSNPSRAAHSFLVVDDNDEHRFLLVKTLLRKFPDAVLQECQDDVTALALAANERLSAAIVHRTVGMNGLELVRNVRRVNARVVLVLVSGIDRSTEALAAGANAFLLYDEWLRIGSVVAELLSLDGEPEQKGPVLV